MSLETWRTCGPASPSPLRLQEQVNRWSEQGIRSQSCGVLAAGGYWLEMQTFSRQSSVRARDAQPFVAPDVLRLTAPAFARA